MSREAMEMALEALESDPISHAGLVNRKQAITALRQALETEQEPVAWANSFDLQNFDMKVRTGPDLNHTVPLYTAPPRKQWIGLTDDDIIYFRYQATFCDEFDAAFMAELIEKDLKEKNHG
jgi:hypothetical protein